MTLMWKILSALANERPDAPSIDQLVQENLRLKRELREAESELAKLKFHHYPQGEST